MNVQVKCSSGESTSLTQNKRFNYENVEAFFEYFKVHNVKTQYVKLHMSRHNITANRVCNLDETDNSVGHVAKLSVLR